MESLTGAIVVAVVIAAQGFADGDPNAGTRFTRSNGDSFFFPPASVLQLTIGVSTGLELTGKPSGSISYGFQQNIPLPTNYTEFLLSSKLRAKRSLIERDYIRNLYTRFAVNGTACLEKVICQVAESPLRGGLLEDIISFAFTPSHHEDLFGRGNEGHPFLVSEHIGKTSGDCDTAFPTCRQTPLDLISQLDQNYYL